MRAMIAATTLVCVLGWTGPTAAQTRPAAQAVNRAYLRQPAFVIPFNVDPLVDSPIEVQLFLSRDGGRTWQLAGRELPAVGRFAFQAPEDGPYWFTSRTIGRDGRQPDRKTLRPELLVYVDRRQPEVDLQVTSPAPRQIRVDFTVIDALLDLQTLQLEYRVGAEAPWQPVGVNIPESVEDLTRYTGQAEWTVAAPSGLVDVRLAVRDRAGNLTAVHRRLAITPPRGALASGPSEPPGAGSASRAASVAHDRDGAQVWQPDNLPPPAAPPDAGRFAAGSSQESFEAGQPSGDSVRQSPLGGIPADPLVRQNTEVTSTPFLPAASAADRGMTPSNAGSTAAPAEVPTEELPPPRTDSPAMTSEPGQRVDALATQRVTGVPPRPPSSEQGGDRMQRAALLPTGEQAVFTKSRRFQLDYDVEAVGVSNVAETQLWVTTDGGRSWKLWGKDPDRQSPFDVELDSDGVFGFRMIVVGDNGLATPAPQPGDTADLWVAVDTSPPSLQFTGAEYGAGHQSGKLVIRWQARDAYLPSSPVAIEYATSPQGPWMEVATNLPNSGEYAWRPQAGMPRRVYLRIQVRDEAGNVATAMHPAAIDLAGLAPKARIRGVIPRQ